MSAISWVESVPSGTSAIGVEPNHLHSIWTALSTGLSTDLYWDGGGGASSASRGELHPGASRTYMAAQSASSNSNNVTQLGRAFFASDTSRLLAYDSTGTFLIGTPYFLEYRSTPGGQLNDPFREVSGATTVTNVTVGATNRVTVVTLPTLGSTGTRPLAAFVQSSERSVLCRMISNQTIVPTGSGLVIEYRGTTNSGSTATFYWNMIVRSYINAL